MKKGFRQMLIDRQKKVNSLVCVGLDPLKEKIPDCITGNALWLRVVAHMIGIIDAVAPYTSMFKPQRAHYEAIPEGEKALQLIIYHIKQKFPNIPVFLDCKRGDIARTQKQYRIAHLEIDGADGMNFSPYMGKDCMEQLFDKENPGKAIVGLCYTSNPSAREVQDVMLENGSFYWEFIASKILAWAQEIGAHENAGLVMAAAYEKPKGSGIIFSEHLSKCRALIGNELWFLIPGIGTQGGFVRETVKASFTGPGSIAINSSSDIIFASNGSDFAEAAAIKTKGLRNQIRLVGGDIEAAC